MTDEELRIKIAEAKGWYLASNDHCAYWSPPTQAECAERDIVHFWNEENPDAPPMMPAPIGMKLCSDGTQFVPDYPGDPREWAGLWAEIEACPTVVSFAAETTRRDDYGPPATAHIIRKAGHPDIDRAESSTLGRAVCLAWLAWLAAREQEGAEHG